MYNNNETLADICRELREDARHVGDDIHDDDFWSNDDAALIYSELADRIEAAAKREEIELREDEAKMLLREYAAAPDESLTPSALELKRELLHLAPEAPGNAAAIREALRGLVAAIRDYHENANLYVGRQMLEVLAEPLNAASAALSEKPKQAPPSNAFEMREGMKHMLRMAQEAKCTTDSFVRQQLVDNICSAATAFLAKPPRNCDVGTLKDQLARFYEECKFYRKGQTVEPCWKCPCSEHGEGTEDCQLKWAQMPYAPAQEGGGE